MSNALWRWKDVLVLITATTTLCSCQTNFSPPPSSQPTNQTSAKPKVVVTTTILCDLTTTIAQDTLDLKCLLKPGVDAHVYQPLPADRRAIEDAQLILYSGYHLEPQLETLIKANTRPIPKIAVAERAVPQPLLGEEEHHHGEHQDEASHDATASHTGQPEGAIVADPHVWQNAQNGIKMAKVIQAELAQLLPEQAQNYRDRTQSLTNAIQQVDQWIQQQIATIPALQRKLVTTHDAFGYYATAYKISLDTALQGISTEEQPSASQIKDLVNTLRISAVPTIFVETGSNASLIETVAKEAKVKLATQPLFSDSLGEPGSGGETYLKMLQWNTKVIVEGLGGKYQPLAKN